MAIYRFRTILDDEEEVTRLVEIRSNSTFQDLHDIIIKALEINVPTAATFFESDNDWHKEGVIGTYGAEKSDKNPKISSYVHDPHQRFLYELKAGIELHFLIELAKILGDNPAASLPAVVGGDGEIPKYYFERPKPVASTGDEDLSEGERSLLKELEAMALIDLDDDEPTDDDMEDVEVEEGEEEAEEKPSKVRASKGSDDEEEYGYAKGEDEDDDEDDYKSDLDFGDGYDDIDMSGFSEENEY